jgi:hypothetical protein
MRLLTSLALAISLSVALALPSACANPSFVQQDVPLAEPFWLELGGLVVFDDGGRALRFKRVVVDSRCPADGLVACVDAGNAELEFTLASGSGDEVPFALNSLAARGPVSEALEGFRIDLLEVAPPARLDPPIAPGEFRARLIVRAEPPE